MKLRTLKQELHAAQVVKLCVDPRYGASATVQVTKVEARQIIDLAVAAGRPPRPVWTDGRILVLEPAR